MTSQRRTITRHGLLLGASMAALALGAGNAHAQSTMFRKTPANPTVQAAEAAAQRATQNQAASTATQRTIEAFQRASALRTQMDAAQRAARAQAMQIQSAIPNGLKPGGLQAANGVSTDPNLWIGASGPVESQQGDRTRVQVDQTQEKAILNWDSFNVGRETDLVFNQQGNTSWAVLNRVTDVSADPSRILGSIKADGTVMVLNRNGVIFGGSAQVNARNIVAAAAGMFDEQFRNRGIYSEVSGDTYRPAFSDAAGAIEVEAGAKLTTFSPSSVVEGGGYVLLLGTSVTNAGSIVAPKGQALLAAGDDFLVRPGFGTAANQASTTRGNEVRSIIRTESEAGSVTNKGMIEAQRGDVTMTGRQIVQDGLLLSTTSVDQRGTIHLLASASDPESRVIVTGNSLSAILPEIDSKETATDAQRDALLKNSVTWDGLRANQSPQFDNFAKLNDRADQSRVEIVSGGGVLFDSGSTILAQGGQIATVATGRVQAEAGALIDVSGIRGLSLDIGSNAISVKIQPNDMRDSPVNRDTGLLNSNEVWIDARDLVLVPAGTDGSSVDRYYTRGGLLEVGGYLGSNPHTIGEWATSAGTITVSASEVVAKSGSVFNIAGGSIDYGGGSVVSSRLQGADGHLYDVNDAPAGIKFVSVGRSLVVEHARWGEQYKEIFSNPMFNRGVYARHEDPYTVGRDGGTLSLSAPTVLFDAEIISEAIQGKHQIIARPAAVTDGYKLGQSQAALGGGLTLGAQTVPSFLSNFNSDVRFTAPAGRIADGLGLSDAVDDERRDTVWFDAAALSQAKLGRIDMVTTGSILVDRPLSLSDGGQLGLVAPNVSIAAPVTVRGGDVLVSDISLGSPLASPTEVSVLTVGDGGAIDTRGLWVNAISDRSNLGGLAHLNGGNVTIRSTQDVILENGSRIDASSGAALLEDGSFVGGHGGDISLIAGDRLYNNQLYAPAKRGLVLDGALASIGASRGGRLTLSTPQSVLIGSFSGGSAGVLQAGLPAQAGYVLAEDLTLQAGERAPLASVLVEATVLPAGSILPSPVSYTVNVIAAGETLQSTYAIPSGNPIEVAADWVVPDSASGIYTIEPLFNGSPAQPGDIIPAGYHLYPGYGQIGFEPGSQGYVVPANVFPSGLPIPPKEVTLPAGTLLQAPLTLEAGAPLPAGVTVPGTAKVSAGTFIAKGISLSKDAAIQPVLDLGGDLFASGFSDYVVDSDVAITVADGTSLAVTMPILRLSGNSFAVGTGDDPAAALERWTPPAYAQDPVRGLLAKRTGAGLTLRTSPSLLEAKALLDGGFADGHSLGAISVGRNADIRVDDGQVIRISGWGEIMMDGRLTARGGVVSVVNERPKSLEANADPRGLSIWIGDHAAIDVSGRAVTALDNRGRSYGSVLNGGDIILGREIGGRDRRNELISTDAFVVVRSGALLDASGAAASLDLSAGLNSQIPSQVVVAASDGGQISLSSSSGLYLDGTLRAFAGGKGAAAGTLSLALESPVYNPNDAERNALELPDSVKAARIITIGQKRGDKLPTDLLPGATDVLTVGNARIGVDQIEAGGFGNVKLFARDLFQFDGDVTLSASQSLTFREGGFGLTATNPEARVSLAAPYVHFDGYTTVEADPSGGNTYFHTQNTPSDLPSGGKLEVSADFIDIGERVSFYGGHAYDGPIFGNGLPIIAPGFADVTLASRGDLRFLKSKLLSAWSGVYTAGNLSLIAGQIYPATDATAIVVAGYPSTGNLLDPNAVLKIGRSSGTAPTSPLSAFGRLALVAATVEQGGVVRAPFGALEIGQIDGTLFRDVPTQPLDLQRGKGTDQIKLLPGSITSVSGAGLVVPYGGTADGLNYYHDGIEVLSSEAGSGFNLRGFVQGVSLGGRVIDIQHGAVLDLSGGGKLAGNAFIAGRGGSVDVLKGGLVEREVRGEATGEIYAIVPGYSSKYAPVAIDNGAGDPVIGQQITLDGTVPGLPAGTYTLLPSNYALLPGGFRVEIGGDLPALGKSVGLPDGSYFASARLGIADTGVVATRPSQVLLTSADSVRRQSGYNETSYSQFAALQAEPFGRTRVATPEDASQLLLRFGAVREPAQALTMLGEVKFSPAQGGRGGTLMVDGFVLDAPRIEVLGSGSKPTEGFVSLYAADLNAIGAATKVIGALRNDSFQTSADSVTLRGGAVLTGAEVFLLGNNAVALESGSTISTIGFSTAAFDANAGPLRFSTGVDTTSAGIGVSNRQLVLGDLPRGVGTVTIAADASLLSEGSVGFLAPGELSLDPDAHLGARSLNLSLPSINIGDAGALAEAKAAGVLPQGWQLDQARLTQLTRGDRAAGVPGLQDLVLTAGQSINLYGTFDLDTTQAGLTLTFNTPALYGWGSQDDAATIRTDRLVWNGIRQQTGVGSDRTYSSLAAGQVIDGGPGTGHGRLEIDAREIVFGYRGDVPAQDETTLDRVALGFASVALSGSERITANSRGSLSVYERGTDAGSYRGGALTLTTPLLTGEAASIMSYATGGELLVRAPGSAPAVDSSAINMLGGEVRLSGGTVLLDTTVALPSGRLILSANGEIKLGERADIDLAGRAVRFFDQVRYSWGGDLILESAAGSIRQASGSTIDVSASGNNAGAIKSTATGASAVTDFGGNLLGKSSTGFDSGVFDLRATTITNFADLNGKLNAGEFFMARAFVVKAGDLVVGDEVRAKQVSISVDAGSLTVNGRINASGEQVGSIRLAARDDLVLTGSAVLDAHGEVLRIDSHGAPIDASNIAQVVLTAAQGTVLLSPGATIDLRSADAIARGELEINAPRIGADDVAVDASGPLTIRGARSIAVNAFRSYTPVNGVVDQSLLDGIDADSTAFIDGALGNAALSTRLAGLIQQSGRSFHFRPGVEIRSDGDLETKFDLDLSGYRYGPDVNPLIRGSGEAGVLVIRAAGNLDVNGSINDGFAPPPPTPDDNGWTTNATFLKPGVPTAEDVTFLLPIDPNYSDRYYILPGLFTEEYPTVVSGQITDWNGTYGPGDQIPGYYYGEVTIAAGTVLSAANPADATLALSLPREQPGQLWAAAPMLAPGSQSWSMRLVAGSDLASAETRTLQARSRLGSTGNITLFDRHVDALTGLVELPSVLRTGAGTLDLLAGGDFTMASLFGVYTAGSQIDGVDNSYRLAPAPLKSGSEAYAEIENRSYFTERGGALNLVAQGDVRGRTISSSNFEPSSPTSSEISYWLWRQGDELGRPAAWSVNFGGYRDLYDTSAGTVTRLAAFSGIGTFGGGDLNVTSGGDAGVRAAENEGVRNTITGGLNLVVGGSGRVVDGALLQSGGGNLRLRVGGDLNPTVKSDDFLTDGMVTNIRGDIDVRASAIGRTVQQFGEPVRAVDPRAPDIIAPSGADGFGGLTIAIGDGATSLQARGDLVVAGSVDIGRSLFAERFAATVPGYTLAAGEPAPWPFTLAEAYEVKAGESLLDIFFFEGKYYYPGTPAPTDVTYAAGQGWAKGTRFPKAVQVAATEGEVRSWFTLWTDRSAINLFSAGGDLVPLATRLNASAFQSRLKLFPGTLRVVAANGSIYGNDTRNVTTSGDSGSIVELAPSPIGQLEFLAGQSILAAGNTFTESGADQRLLATPLRPAFEVLGPDPINGGVTAIAGNARLTDERYVVSFGPDTASGNLHLGDDEPSRFYAVNGDIIGLRAGLIFNGPFNVQAIQYLAAEPTQIRAGRDIVSLGNVNLPSLYGSDRFNGSFFVHDQATDISLIAAGRDLLYTDAFVAGPGTLEVRAGRNLFQGARGILNSIGAVNTDGPVDVSGGANIAVLVGVGGTGPAYASFARLYFDPANRADPMRPLADQEGKVVTTYDQSLQKWLDERFGYTGDDALGYFLSLPEEQQGVLVRKIYFEELRQGGREYNDPDSRRFNSYLRGREAIRTLFPDKDKLGRPITYDGDLTMFSGYTPDFLSHLVSLDSTIRTDFGGDIQIITPGGQTTIGVEGLIPGSSAGLLTQGAGDIEIYSQKSILLGLTRVFTTFGGNIVMWSSEGDINAGRGARGTIVYAPVRRIYDLFGNIALSPTAPTSGAGIGTLDPIPEVPAGDIDLIAPLGTIDAGEAGIRVSGNINLAALQILNAANIQVKGQATGIPLAAAVNTGALTAASAATTAVTNEAAQLAERSKPQPIREMPTILNVRFLGFGPAE